MSLHVFQCLNAFCLWVQINKCSFSLKTHDKITNLNMKWPISCWPGDKREHKLPSSDMTFHPQSISIQLVQNTHVLYWKGCYFLLVSTALIYPDSKKKKGKESPVKICFDYWHHGFDNVESQDAERLNWEMSQLPEHSRIAPEKMFNRGRETPGRCGVQPPSPL